MEDDLNFLRQGRKTQIYIIPIIKLLWHCSMYISNHIFWNQNYYNQAHKNVNKVVCFNQNINIDFLANLLIFWQQIFTLGQNKHEPAYGLGCEGIEELCGPLWYWKPKISWPLGCPIMLNIHQITLFKKNVTPIQFSQFS